MPHRQGVNLVQVNPGGRLCYGLSQKATAGNPRTSCQSPILAHCLQIGPALQDIAMLKRARRTLQKQVAQLQQQLSAAEAESQAAGANSAAERARAGKALAKAQQQLAAALQRLQHMADREQQQQLAMQEVSH